MLGRFIHPADIIWFYEQCGIFLYGVFGVYYTTIVKFFAYMGHRVTISNSQHNFDRVAKSNRANILFYCYWWGTHYVALKWTGKYFIVYNLYSNRTEAYGYESIYTLIKKQGGWGCVLISIS